jgi:hypothetical protein
MPIYRASKNIITLQILQLVSIIWKLLRDFEGADSQGIKFSMLAFILLGRIPFEYYIYQLEILLSYSPVKILLDLLLMLMCFFQ